MRVRSERRPTMSVRPASDCMLRARVPVSFMRGWVNLFPHLEVRGAHLLPLNPPEANEDTNCCLVSVTGSSCEVEYVELQPAGHDARTGPAYPVAANSSSVILGIGELSFNAFHNIIHVTRKRDGEIAVRIGKDTPAGCQALPEDRIHPFPDSLPYPAKPPGQRRTPPRPESSGIPIRSAVSAPEETRICGRKSLPMKDARHVPRSSPCVM